MGPLTEHHVVVKIVAQVFPELERMFIKLTVAGKHVVGADNGGVTPRIPTTKPAFFHDGDIGDTMVLREIIRGSEPVQSGTDNHDIVLRLGFRVTPGALPTLLAGQAVDEYFPGGIGFHVSS